jgi:hypothetical protein
MFSQVVGTLLRLTVAHAEQWLPVRGSHAIPAYGFERFADPPPLDIDVARLLGSFARGRVAVVDTWAKLVPPVRLEALASLADEAAAALDEVTRADTPTSIEDVSFHFPDDLWARIVYDLALSARGPVLGLDLIVAALVPIYFARVASLVIEAREMSTLQAETLVERQAQAFELAKADFATRWHAGEGLVPRTPQRRASDRAGAVLKPATDTGPEAATLSATDRAEAPPAGTSA